jgi:hypothetical protein
VQGHFQFENGDTDRDINAIFNVATKHQTGKGVEVIQTIQVWRKKAREREQEREKSSRNHQFDADKQNIPLINLDLC